MGKADTTIQLGMFGAPAVLAGTHVVQAHTRLLPSGTLAHVGEHLRWNRPHTHVTPKPRVSHDVPSTQGRLFAPIEPDEG